MKNRPYFIWDYDISEQDIRRFLTKGSETEKQWAIARLESGNVNPSLDFIHKLAEIMGYRMSITLSK